MNFAAKEIVWRLRVLVRGGLFLEEMGVKQTKPTRMLGDNQSAINFCYDVITIILYLIIVLRNKSAF